MADGMADGRPMQAALQAGSRCGARPAMAHDEQNNTSEAWRYRRTGAWCTAVGKV